MLTQRADHRASSDTHPHAGSRCIPEITARPDRSENTSPENKRIPSQVPSPGAIPIEPMSMPYMIYAFLHLHQLDEQHGRFIHDSSNGSIIQIGDAPSDEVVVVAADPPPLADRRLARLGRPLGLEATALQVPGRISSAGTLRTCRHAISWSVTCWYSLSRADKALVVDTGLRVRLSKVSGRGVF